MNDNEKSDEEIIEECHILFHKKDGEYQNKMNYKKAVEMLDLLVSKGSAKGILRRATYYFMVENNIEKAIELYEKIANFSAVAADNLGSIYNTHNQYEKAKYYFEIGKNLGSKYSEMRLEELEE